MKKLTIVAVLLLMGLALGRARCDDLGNLSSHSALVTESTAAYLKVNMTMGIQRIFDLSFAPAGRGGISLGNPNVINATLIAIAKKKYQLALLPRSPGLSDVLIRDQNGKLRARLYVEVQSSTGEQRDSVVDDLCFKLGIIDGHAHKKNLTRGTQCTGRIPNDYYLKGYSCVTSGAE